MDARLVTVEFYADTLARELVADAYAQQDKWRKLAADVAADVAAALKKHYLIRKVQLRVTDFHGDEIWRGEL
ncbi:MAG: hypothetical protein J5556_07040 [Deltaproteobacteria bacterium]|nr:hypothetical protein [Deltaproteobacteria bacterium]